MAVIVYPTSAGGSYVAYGLSTDTKPTSPPTASVFIETDTDNTYTASGSVWTLPTKNKTIKSVTDFPAPVSNVITLEDNTSYRIAGTVSIDVNTIVCGIKNTIYGFDKVNDVLTSTSTGTMFTIDSTTTNKTALFFSTMTAQCASGTMFSVTSSSQRNIVVFDNCNFTSCSTFGTFNNFITLALRNTAITTATVGGATFSGVNGTLQVRDGQFRTVTGTCFNLSTATFTTVEFSRSLISPTTGETFLSGLASGGNIVTAGVLHDNIFSGLGTYVNTITGQDANWRWSDNVGVTNTFHGSLHKSGGGDAIKLDELAAPTDIATLNATTSAHGLMPKGTGSTTTFFRSDMTQAVPAGGGGGSSATTVETNISTARWTGKFTITDAAITPTSKVLCWQAPGPYTGKGTRADEAELQPVQVIAVEPATGTAVVTWQTPPMVTMQIEPRMTQGTATQIPKDPQGVLRQTATRLGKVRGNVKFSYLVLT